jgi:hypothetical protein
VTPCNLAHRKRFKLCSPVLDSPRGARVIALPPLSTQNQPVSSKLPAASAAALAAAAPKMLDGNVFSRKNSPIRTTIQTPPLETGRACRIADFSLPVSVARPATATV